MADYDLVVIGAGPAGEKGAAQAAYFGKRVAIIEARAQPGGACVHTGTIPSKTLRESALYLSGVRSRGLYGVNYLVKRDVSVQDFMFRRHRVVQQEVERIRRNCDRHRIDLLGGRAELIDEHTVRVTDNSVSHDLNARVVLIATGSKPFRPTFLPFDAPHIYDSDTILEMDAMPRSLCIIGAGVIGCEYATTFAALGIRVVLIESHGALLPFLDREIATQLQEQMMKLGVQTLFHESVASVESQPGHGHKVVLGSGDDFVVDSVLFAAGRVGNTATLQLDRLGINTTDRGLVAVNEHFQTSVPHVYAAGDVIGFPALASTSMEQGRVAMCHAFDLKYKQHLDSTLPYGIYTIPEVSAVGETEESCIAKKITYEVGRARFADNARGEIMGEEDGFIKLLFKPTTLELLGAHIIGDRATEIIHTALAALHFHGTLDDFIQMVFNFPSLSESFKYAAYDGLGRLSARVQREGVAGMRTTEVQEESD